MGTIGLFKYSPEEIATAMQDLRAQLGHIPTQGEFRAAYSNKYYSTIRKTVGWRKLSREVFGREYHEARRHSRLRYSDEDVVTAVQKFYHERGYPPALSEFRHHNGLPTESIVKRMGGLNNVLRRSGVPLRLQRGTQVFFLSAEEYDQYKSGGDDSTAGRRVVLKRQHRLKKQLERHTRPRQRSKKGQQ